MILVKKNFFSSSAALLHDPSRLMSKWIIHMHRLSHHLDSLPSNSIKLIFLYLSYCSAVITMTLLLLLLLVSYEQGELMVCGMDFQKPRKREYTVALSFCLFQHPPEVLHCSRNRILVSSRKGLNFIKMM